MGEFQLLTWTGKKTLCLIPWIFSILAHSPVFGGLASRVSAMIAATGLLDDRGTRNNEPKRHMFPPAAGAIIEGQRGVEKYVLALPILWLYRLSRRSWIGICVH